MKLWKKVYICTLAITVVFVKIGILGLFRFTYGQMLSAEKQHCKSEFELLQQSLSANVREMEQNVPLSIDDFNKFLNSYSSFYEDNIRLTGLHGEQVVFGDERENTNERIDLQKNGVQIKKDRYTSIYMVGYLDESHKSYRIVMKKELRDFDKTWSVLWPLYLAGSLLLSIGLSLVLGIVVKYLMKPIDVLTEAVGEIRSGDLSKRVMLRGHDELTDLGMQFNDMAESLEKNMQLLEEEVQKKQHLIDNLAHEMNTPITSIQGFAQFMRIGDIQENERQECLEFILTEAKRLKDISSTILEMARLNHTDIPMETFSVKKLCQKMERLMHQKCRKQNVALSLNCQAKDFWGNEALLESLLQNLFYNSLHALREKGRITIDIAYRKEGDIQLLSIVVGDDGCGIPEPSIPYIFEPFYRVDKSRSRSFGGSGLGLPFCRRIAQLHGGDIRVKSKENAGTEMTVLLPFKTEILPFDNNLERV